MKWAALAAALPMLGAFSAEAAPIALIDVDPATAGVQDFLEARVGEIIQVDLILAEVDVLDPVQGFSVQLGFDGSVLTGLDAQPGPFLPPPVVILEKTVGSDSILLTALSLGGVASGTGVLASFTVEATNPGTSALVPDPILLTGPLGDPVPVAEVFGGSIEVSDPIPEPAAAALYVLGLLLVATRARSPR